MGTVQKVFWWIFWYAIVWFGFACLIAGISEMQPPMLIQAILFFSMFIFPGWYATRKVKQKELKKEMEQRTGNFPSRSQHIPQPPTTLKKASEIKPQAVATSDDFDTGRKKQVQNVAPPMQTELPNLNAATVEDLTKLSAVNRILAMKIVEQRSKEGDYVSFEDLFARVQLSVQAQEELKRHFSLLPAGDGRFIDF